MNSANAGYYQHSSGFKALKWTLIIMQILVTIALCSVIAILLIGAEVLQDVDLDKVEGIKYKQSEMVMGVVISIGGLLIQILAFFGVCNENFIIIIMLIIANIAESTAHFALQGDEGIANGIASLILTILYTVYAILVRQAKAARRYS